MRITVRLTGTLRGKLPIGTIGDAVEIPLAAGTAIAKVLEWFRIPVSHVQLATINGEAEYDAQRLLADGDELALFPPISGG